MRITLISSHFPPKESPESAHTMFLCEKLAENGHNVHLITSYLLPSAPAPRGYTIHPLIKNWGWRELPGLLKTIIHLRPEAILLIYIDWIYDCHPMVTFLPSFTKIIRRKIKFVTQFENISGLTGFKAPIGWINQFLSNLANLIFNGFLGSSTYGTLLKDSDAIIALSERHAEVFEASCPECKSKVKVIPAPPIMRFARSSSKTDWRKKYGLDKNHVVLSYFGYLYAMKGIEVFLESLQFIPNNVSVLIIGGTSDISYLDKLKQITRANKVFDRVFWMGHCKPEEDLGSQCLYASDICVLPFNDGVRLNNSSLAVAVAHGLPIVTTQGEKLEAPFINNTNVKLCPPKNPEALAAAINELIGAPDLRQKLSDSSKKLSDEYFSWEHTIKSTLDCLSR